jgi:hypothetical protein
MDNVGAPLSPGPPTISADGRWLWNGMQWTARAGPTGFRSLNAHRTWAVAALAAWIASAALQLIADATRINVASAVINGTGVSLTDAQNSDRLVSLAALIHLGVFVLAAVAFLMWLYRAVANNHALGAYELRFTPGWAVGWWFVPFANLVRPLQIVAEAWRAADPSASRSTAETRSHLRAPAIVIAWWLLYLIGNVIALFERWTSGDPLTRLRGATEIDIVSLVVLSAAAGMAITLIVLLTRREEAKIRQLTP